MKRVSKQQLASQNFFVETMCFMHSFEGHAHCGLKGGTTEKADTDNGADSRSSNRLAPVQTDLSS